jgi:hypothetical protein
MQTVDTSSPQNAQLRAVGAGTGKWKWIAGSVALILVLGAGLIMQKIDVATRTGESIPVRARADLPKFMQVHPYLYRGGAPSDKGLLQLKQMGVKTIIDFRVKPAWVIHERQTAQSLGIRYINLPVGDFLPSNQQQEIFLTEASRASTQPEAGPLFVHCAHGSDRTGFFVALWRVKHDGWSLPAAVNEMFQNGFLIHRLPFFRERIAPSTVSGSSSH